MQKCYINYLRKYTQFIRKILQVSIDGVCLSRDVDHSLLFSRFYFNSNTVCIQNYSAGYFYFK